MSDAFIGQIMLAGFNFAPRNFAVCDGQLLSVNQNLTLFALLGTQYGGDGDSNFALPDLRGRTPIGASAQTAMGTRGGSETVSLVAVQLPAHGHDAQASTDTGTTRNPTGGVFADSGTQALYGPTSDTQVPLAASSIASAGNSQPHPNMQPYNVLNFCIALSGIFPSPS